VIWLTNASAIRAISLVQSLSNLTITKPIQTIFVVFFAPVIVAALLPIQKLQLRIAKAKDFHYSRLLNFQSGALFSFPLITETFGSRQRLVPNNLNSIIKVLFWGSHSTFNMNGRPPDPIAIGFISGSSLHER